MQKDFGILLLFPSSLGVGRDKLLLGFALLLLSLLKNLKCLNHLRSRVNESHETREHSSWKDHGCSSSSLLMMTDGTVTLEKYLS
jgi:hypothetical protein